MPRHRKNDPWRTPRLMIGASVATAVAIVGGYVAVDARGRNTNPSSVAQIGNTFTREKDISSGQSSPDGSPSSDSSNSVTESKLHVYHSLSLHAAHKVVVYARDGHEVKGHLKQWQQADALCYIPSFNDPLNPNRAKVHVQVGDEVSGYAGFVSVVSHVEGPDSRYAPTFTMAPTEIIGDIGAGQPGAVTAC